eukprot:2640908-Rhodomonas_salina.1
MRDTDLAMRDTDSAVRSRGAPQQLDWETIARQMQACKEPIAAAAAAAAAATAAGSSGSDQPAVI